VVFAFWQSSSQASQRQPLAGVAVRVADELETVTWQTLPPAPQLSPFGPLMFPLPFGTAVIVAENWPRAEAPPTRIVTASAATTTTITPNRNRFDKTSLPTFSLPRLGDSATPRVTLFTFTGRALCSAPK
jgi:hypothetical protein